MSDLEGTCRALTTLEGQQDNDPDFGARGYPTKALIAAHSDPSFGNSDPHSPSLALFLRRFCAVRRGGPRADIARIDDWIAEPGCAVMLWCLPVAPMISWLRMKPLRPGQSSAPVVVEV